MCCVIIQALPSKLLFVQAIDFKQLPCEEVLGKVDDLIAGLAGFVSACYGKEVSGKKSNIRVMNMVMILTTRVKDGEIIT